MNDLIYCMDTTILIHTTHYYPKNIFKSMQIGFGEMADEGRLITVGIVFKEYIHDYDGEWFNKRDDIIKPFTSELNHALLQLMSDLPDFVDYSKTTKEADQPLVALAMSENKQSKGKYHGNVVLLTMEKPKKPKEKRLKIPDACD